MVPLIVPRDKKEKRTGLLAFDTPPNGWGMLFRDVPYIHTIGMKYPIDVVLVKASIVQDVGYVPPGIDKFGNDHIEDIIEFGPGQAKLFGIWPGIKVSLSWINSLPYLNIEK